MQTEAFYALIDLVAKITQNYHYNPNLKTRLKCDASKSGLGACLEQETADGWVPIDFASRQLNSQEVKYSIGRTKTTSRCLVNLPLKVLLVRKQI